MWCRWIKRVLIPVVSILLADRLAAQHYLGVRGGYGGGYARFEYVDQTVRESRFLFGWPSGGISWKYFTEESVVGAVQADLQFAKKGYRILENGRFNEETGQYHYTHYVDRTLSIIELPFMWHIHVYLFKQRVRVFLNLGIYASYILDAYEKSGETENWKVLQEGKYRMNSVVDNQFEYGLCGGFGFSYLFGRYEIFAEGRYSFGYGDIMRSRSKYPESLYNRTPVDMINISMGLYYRLGKGGIRSFENPRVRTPKQPWGERMPQGPNKRS
ncbi:MAG: PorT family protein [Rikenellaceae bacterium]|nr:PorT family protein [Rikenellaceae bacterium]